MSADPWEPWLTELEGACDAGDGEVPAYHADGKVS
jgi:hypothetical protein